MGKKQKLIHSLKICKALLGKNIRKKNYVVYGSESVYVNTGVVFTADLE